MINQSSTELLRKPLINLEVSMENKTPHLINQLNALKDRLKDPKDGREILEYVIQDLNLVDLLFNQCECLIKDYLKNHYSSDAWKRRYTKWNNEVDEDEKLRSMWQDVVEIGRFCAVLDDLEGFETYTKLYIEQMDISWKDEEKKYIWRREFIKTSKAERFEGKTFSECMKKVEALCQV